MIFLRLDFLFHFVIDIELIRSLGKEILRFIDLAVCERPQGGTGLDTNFIIFFTILHSLVSRLIPESIVENSS